MADVNLLSLRLSKIIVDPQYPFSIDDFKDHLIDALSEYDPSLTFDTLPANEEIWVMKIAQRNCYSILAGKYAQGIWFQINNDEYHGDMPTKNYLSLATTLDEQINNRITTGTIIVQDADRRSLATQSLVPPPLDPTTPSV